jgi:hypothetical protein
MLTSAAYIKPGWDSHGVDVNITVRFAKPLRASTIRENAALRNMKHGKRTPLPSGH